MTRLVVFGAAGFLGLNLTEDLLGRGLDVVGVDRSDTPDRLGGTKWVKADFLAPDSWSDVLREGDVVYHLISTTLPKSSNEDTIFDVGSNVCGTLKLLDACVSRRVAKVIFISSGGTVYGQPLELPLSEAHPTSPLSSYGITKLAIEKYLALYRHLHGLDYQIFRLANPYGPYQNPRSSQGAISVFMDRALHGRPIEVWGDGSVIRDYIYVSDVTEALIRAIDYSGPNKLLNLGSGVGVSLREIIEGISRLLGLDLHVNYSESRRVDVSKNVLDIRSIKESLGWQPKIMLEDGLALTRNYLTKANLA